MIGRWLWLDHVPAGLTLTREQRQQVLKLARHNRMKGPLIRRSDWFTRITFITALALLSIFFTGWILYLPRAGFGTAGLVISNVGGILFFNALIWVCIAWFTYRTNGPYVRRALWEVGQPVCVNCGYILTAATDPLAPCPECGTRHETKPQMNTDIGVARKDR